MTSKQLKQQIAQLKARAQAIHNQPKLSDMTLKGKVIDFLDSLFGCADRKEIWMTYPDNSDYQVSDMGNIMSTKYGRQMILQQTTDGRGYKMVSIWSNGHKKTVRVHQLVAQTFIPNPDNKPQVNHKDENKSNNDIKNLEWVTNRENKSAAVKNSETSSKYLGVCWNKKRNKWQSGITFEKKRFNLGLFEDEESAFQAYLDFMRVNNIENKYATA